MSKSDSSHCLGVVVVVEVEDDEEEEEEEEEDDDEQFWLDCWWRRGEFKWRLVEVESGPPLLDEVCSIVLLLFSFVSFSFVV